MSEPQANSEPPRSLRVFYAAGPGDVVGTYRHWCAGHDDPTQTHVTYSGQFFEACRAAGAIGYVMSSHPRTERVDDERFTVEHRPIAFADHGGLRYHLGQLWYGLRMIATIKRWRADVAVVATGTHWFVLRLLPWLGVKVVPTLHCTLWPKYKKVSRINRWLLRLAKPLFRRGAFAVLSASHDINQQLAALCGGAHRPVIDFLPYYKRDDFAGVAPVDPGRRPYRVLYAGRIERNKGVFDLLAIAESLRDAGRDDIVFDVCGDGGALGELRAAVEAKSLQQRFVTHGHCDRPTLRRLLGESHAVVVPTTTDFVEGFNQVVVEGVLAGRPVVTSGVCPAAAYVVPAVSLVPPDDADAYRAAIVRLADDAAHERSLRESCAAVQRQFYDDERNWAAALRTVLGAVNRGDVPKPVSWLVEPTV